MSFFVDAFLIAVETVFDLSNADIPVVTPFFASMLTVNAVLNLVPFELDISLRPSLSDCFLSRAKQINPRPYFAIKFIFFGVHLLAKKTKSPSFSLLSSSTKIKILPFFAKFKSFSILQYFFFIFLEISSIDHTLN